MRLRRWVCCRSGAWPVGLAGSGPGYPSRSCRAWRCGRELRRRSARSRPWQCRKSLCGLVVADAAKRDVVRPHWIISPNATNRLATSRRPQRPIPGFRAAVHPTTKRLKEMQQDGDMHTVVELRGDRLAVLLMGSRRCEAWNAEDCSILRQMVDDARSSLEPWRESRHLS